MKPGPRITLIACGLLGAAFTGPVLVIWWITSDRSPALGSTVVHVGLPLVFLVAIAIGAFSKKDDAISIRSGAIGRPPRKLMVAHSDENPTTSPTTPP